MHLVNYYYVVVVCMNHIDLVLWLIGWPLCISITKNIGRKDYEIASENAKIAYSFYIGFVYVFIGFYIK